MTGTNYKYLYDIKNTCDIDYRLKECFRRFSVILWTIQSYLAYEKMLETGFLTVNEDYLFCEDDFKFAYDWMAKEMVRYGLILPVGINYPVWAWCQWEGKRKRRDMRESGYAKRGEKIVKLTIEVEDKEVLLSDFDLFHYVLNYWYLPENGMDDDTFEKEYTALGYSWNDLRDISIQTKDMENIRARIRGSWNRIFDLEREDENLIYGLDSQKSIQATFWRLSLNQVIKAETFIAK